MFIVTIFDFILHIDVHLAEIISQYGVATYAILFGIIFAETGFVMTPFLPGDSLLFAAGAFAALGSLNIFVLILLLCIAAVIGDTVNYWIGHFFGKKIIANPKIPIKDEHIKETEAFFEKHGGKTIILARFVPIVRTFAPFVAGIGKMHYGNFISYNVIGGIVWVFLFSLAGYFFGNIPAVKHNFSIVIMVIILISILPMVYHSVQKKFKKAGGK
ncbi:DedA family protein [Patescibacteria group bacterium]